MTKILMLLDGSVACEHAVKAAQEFGPLMSADITLLKVLDEGDVRNKGEGARRDAENYLEEVKNRAFPAADTRVYLGRTPVLGILNALDEEKADLVIMSTHGSSGPREQAMGSVARDLVKSSTVPVMLVGLSVA